VYQNHKRTSGEGIQGSLSTNEQATTYSSTEEELAEARRTIAEQKGEVSSLQKQLSESQAHARELLSTSRAGLKQVKLTLDTATQQLQCNEAKRADFEVEHSVSGQHKMQKREADGAERQMVEVPTVAATEVASAQLGETFGEHIWNQPEQRRQRANAINDVQPTFGHDPGALETGDDCFTIISQRISGVCKALSIQKIT
jgi:hypothetical protein